MDIASVTTAEPTVLAVGSEVGEWAGGTIGATADILTARDAGSAVSTVEDETVDCVVVGTDAGDDDGLDVIRSVRSLDPDLPVVFAPAAPDGSGAAAASAAGATRYLPRSATGHSLSSAIDELVTEFDRRRQQRREREMFRTLLSTVPQSLYFKDDEARHVCTSDKAEKAADGGLIGKTDVDVLGDEIGVEAARRSYEDDLDVIESGDPIVGKEEHHVLEGGKHLWLRTSKFPWRNEDGEIIGLIGQTHDISAEKKHEHELQHEKRRMEQFASFASHDLRNPLLVANGHLQQALETGDESAIRAAIDSLDRMEQLIEDLLNIVGTDAGEAEEVWTAFAAVTERSWNAVDAADATLEVAVPSDVQVRAASGALRQLLENLLSNAVEHGGPDVTVGVGLTETGFYVEDDGPGIPAEDREHVFEHGYTTGGTGVGLAVAAEVAEAHGWEPSVTEGAAGGARFEFDRTLRRYAERDSFATGAAIDLESVTTVGAEIEGQASHDGDSGWTLYGAGEALWGGIEEYTAVHGTAEGDCRIVGRLTDLDQVHEYSKAGLVVTEAAGDGAIDPDRPLGFVGATAAHGHEAAWRTDPGGPVDTRQIDDGDVIPRWYRIDRVGDRVTCYGSENGEEWTVLDQNVVDLSGPVAVGLAVNSHEVGIDCEATFEDVRLVELATEPSL